MKVTRNLCGALLASMFAALCQAAAADESPAGCTGNRLDVSLSSPPLDSPAAYRIGDRLELTVAVANDGPAACDVSGLRVLLELPDRDGTPGSEIEVAEGVSVPAGQASRVIAPAVPYEVELADGTFHAPVSLSWTAREHSGATARTITGGETRVLRITRPRTELVARPSVSSGRAPLDVTYTYRLTNTSPAGEGSPAAVLFSPRAQDFRSLIRDTNCAPVMYLSGDLNDPFAIPTLETVPVGDGSSEPETWTFSCSRTLPAPGVYSGTVTVDGLSTADYRPWPSSATSTEVRVVGSDLAVEKTHEGELIAGGRVVYTLRVTNQGNEPSSGPVILADHLPDGLVPVSIGGPGWSCDRSSLVCDRTDALGSGMSFPPVELEARVRKDPPATIVNRATVTNAGDDVPGNDSVEDPATIRTPGIPASAPSNRFRIGSVESRKNGSVEIRVKLPGPGLLAADDLGRANLFRRSIRRARSPGTLTIKLASTARLKRRLAKAKRPIGARIQLRFTPKGGLAATRKVRVRVGRT